jgi:hypothetical protein
MTKHKADGANKYLENIRSSCTLHSPYLAKNFVTYRATVAML